MTKKERRDIYQEVTSVIVTALEADQGPGEWKRPWRWIFTGLDINFPHNLDGKPYRGVNVLLLGISSHSRDSELPNTWGTFKRWQKEGAQVRKGEKGTLVTFWKFQRIKDKDSGKEETIPLIRHFSVFHCSQVDDWDATGHLAKLNAKRPEPKERLEAAQATADAYLDREGISLTETGDKACYAPSLDVINVPAAECFPEIEDYHSTVFHEIVHSTGHQSRLNREFGSRFGNKSYAFEELVAELGAAFLCGAVGIEDKPRDDHAKYLASWLDVLKKDKRAIFTAAGKAQKAADFVIETEAEELAEAA